LERIPEEKGLVPTNKGKDWDTTNTTGGRKYHNRCTGLEHRPVRGGIGPLGTFVKRIGRLPASKGKKISATV